ncbi:hypothetical protein LCGC14_2858080, partial [marine sediment metagenome]
MTSDEVVNVRWEAKMNGNRPDESEDYSVLIIGSNQVGGVYKLVDGGKNMVEANGYNHYSMNKRPMPSGATFEELNDE